MSKKINTTKCEFKSIAFFSFKVALFFQLKNKHYYSIYFIFNLVVYFLYPTLNHIILDMEIKEGRHEYKDSNGTVLEGLLIYPA